MRSVLITGASGGFGYEFARQLEPLGYRLLLHGRDEVRLGIVLRSLAQPGRHRCITADLDTRDGIEALLARIADEEELAGLVNNAGYGVWGAFELRELIPQAGVLDTDLTSPVVLTHRLLPRLIRNGGFVINVSSLAGECPLPYMSTYAAAKAGLTYWSEALRTELAGRLRVVTLAPGPSPTGFREISGMPHSVGGLFRVPAARVVSRALTCLRRGGGYCVPGARHRLLWLLQKLVPRRLALTIMARSLRHPRRR